MALRHVRNRCKNSVVPTALGDVVPIFPALKAWAISSRP